MIGHPREEQLLAFQDHRLDDRRRRRLAAHLSGCQRCRNVVQAHRTVRGVFALEAPFAPDGVLERVLASRATGMIIMLPVAETSGTRRHTIPLRSILIAASVLLTVAVGIQVVPLTHLQQMWGAWSAAVADWHPLGGQGIVNLRYPMPPVADGATIVPGRIRPVVATYRTNVMEDGSVTRTSTYTMELMRDGDGWRLHTTESRYAVTAQLSASLAPLAWQVIVNSGQASRFRRVTYFTVRGDSIQVTYRRDPRDTLPRSLTPSYDSLFAVVLKPEAPPAVDEAHFHALMMGLDLRRGWVGSFYPMISPRYWRRFHTPPTTYMVVGEEIVTTPAGQFDTWRLSDLMPAPFREGGIWVSKESGLVVKASQGGRWGSETLLESAAFP